LVSEHRASRAPRIALFLLILVLAVPFAGAAFAEGNLAVGIGVSGTALVLIVVAQALLSKTRLRMFVHGVERRGPRGTKRIAWSNLASYQLQIVDNTAAVAGGAGGMLGVLVARAIVKAVKKTGEIAPTAVVLSAKDGTRIALSHDVIGYKELAKTLVPSLAERLFPAAKQEYDRGAEVSFGKKLTLQRGVGFTFTGLFGKKHVLPLAEVASAVVERTALVIRRRDTNAPWQTIPTIALENPGVLQRFIETGGRPHDDGLPLAWTS
jgi:hypothetical protein